VKKFVLGWLVLELMDRLTGKVGLVGLATADATSAPYTVWAALFLTLAYIYLDFSGYSDIAIGSARLFGLRIMENFNLPFLATNLQAFWQRWHMTLANWCRTYIYMSMIGLTRNPYAAVLATFATMGLWHAASPHWIIWGIWHGLGLAWLMYWGQLARRRKIVFFKTRSGAVLGWAMTLSYVALGGAFTALHERAPITAALRLIGMAFGLSS
jgi:alginate O-acetyltransferase complex protein AlgI